MFPSYISKSTITMLTIIIWASCHYPDFVTIFHSKSFATNNFSSESRNNVWVIYLHERPLAVAHPLKPIHWSPLESATKWWIVKLDSVQMVIRNFKLDRKNSNKKPRICNHFRNELSRGVFWTVLFSTVWLIINKQSSNFVSWYSKLTVPLWVFLKLWITGPSIGVTNHCNTLNACQNFPGTEFWSGPENQINFRWCRVGTLTLRWCSYFQ